MMNDNSVMLARVRALATAAMEDVAGDRPGRPAIAGPLSADELRSLRHLPPRLLASMSTALAKLPAAAAAARRRPDGSTPAGRCRLDAVARRRAK